MPEKCDWVQSVPIPEEVIEKYWKRTEGGLTQCRKHGTSFDEDEEPCWQCWNESQGEV